ncbi:MAG TPA: hypothetical protein VJ184_16575 [Chryseolinea sp.]|nr:hypothetical protein [Chryseolinea sp.]
MILVTEDSRGQSLMAMRDINDVMKSHTEELMSIPGVVGVYIGALEDGSPCIKVMVIEKTPELERIIPNVLEGYPVLIIETGEIRPLSE